MHATKKMGLGSIAAAGAVALVMGMGAPAMAAPAYTAPVITGPATVTLPSKSSTKVNLSATFQGAAASTNLRYYWYDASYASPTVTLLDRNKKVKSSNVNAVKYAYTNDYSSTAVPGTAKGINFSISPYTAPGKYRLNLPVTQKGYNPSSTQTLFGYKQITIKANSSYSKANTGLSGSGRVGKTWKVSMLAPAYQAGAKVTLYTKAKGQKKFKKVGAAKVLKNYNSTYSRTGKLKLSGKYTKKGSKVYVK